MTYQYLNKIAFLLGSGISFPAQMPSIKDITEQILSGQNIMRDAKGNYSFGLSLYAHVGIPDEYVPKIVGFLKQIKTEIDNYYESEPEKFKNYEDLYYVASQICDSESVPREYDNPVVQAFIDKIVPGLIKLQIIKQSYDIGQIADEATHYISDIVWNMLLINPSRLDHLSFLKDACLDNQFSNVDILTLNHDTLIEQYLSQNNIHLIDGFGEPLSDVRYWNPDLFESSKSKYRLLKLHGSVNWFRFRPDGGDWSQESIGIPLGRDIWHTRDKHGQIQMPIEGRPMFLAGTFNKMLQYTSGIYSDLHYQLCRSLRNMKRLVVCGYGFSDKGINTRIIEWVYSGGQNKITIIHPSPDNLRQRARGAISKKWEDWISTKRASIIPKKVEETSWQDIKDTFEC
jgi:hypothetical protein